jgi:RNA polymerase sigma-70 factor (ECF subfamily)
LASADDTVSEVFVIAWRRLEDVPTDEALPWLLACARRVLANQRRSDRRVGALRSRLAGAPILRTDEGDGALREALNELGERDRELLLLTAWEGLSAAEAAVVVGCSHRTFSVRAYRARKRLEAALARIETALPPPATTEAMR